MPSDNIADDAGAAYCIEQVGHAACAAVLVSLY